MSAPPLIYAPAPCPRCGAATAALAETLCRPSQDETGEYDCPGGEPDNQGRLLQPTPESIAALDHWIDTDPTVQREIAAHDAWAVAENARLSLATPSPTPAAGGDNG